jgi:hypothetical protein
MARTDNNSNPHRSHGGVGRCRISIGNKQNYQNRGDLDAELTRKNGIMFLLNTSNAFQASIRVDKVFALIGLANDLRPSSDKLLLRPNCERPVEMVMNDMARAIIHQHENLTPLQYVRSYCREHPSLPTWVPDWTSARNPRDSCWSQSHQSAILCFSRWESRASSLRRRWHAGGQRHLCG